MNRAVLPISEHLSHCTEYLSNCPTKNKSERSRSELSNLPVNVKYLARYLAHVHNT